MLDRPALALLRPLTDGAARRCRSLGVTADQVTITGLAFGLLAALAIALGAPLVAIPLIILGRAADGIDGALARLDQPTDRGAFLDIALDFVFYASIPLAFAVSDPAANALAAALLLAAFVATGTSFLAYAIIAAKRGRTNATYPGKAFYYLGGLTEGTETILFFLLVCLWPSAFAVLALVFAALCLITALTRLWAGWRDFTGGNS
jgi:phosphatidylglycerophosphate synthase